MAASLERAYLLVWGASEYVGLGGQYNVAILHCVDQGRFDYFLNRVRKEALCIEHGRLNLSKLLHVTVGVELNHA
jgi:hypothetical protein